MSARRLVGGARDRALGLVDRSEHTSNAVVATAVSVAARLGADADLLAEARNPERPLNRSLQIIQWALAAEGRAAFPRHFSPGDHLIEPVARSRAVSLLSALDDRAPDIERQLIGLDDSSGLRATLQRIEHDLRSAIGVAATRPQRGDGLDSDLQLAVVSEAVGALYASDLRPFLMSGSLLGFRREGRLMQHDYDVDLGLLPGADAEAATSALDRLPTFGVDIVGPRIVATHESGVTVDVFPHEMRDGLFWHATHIHEWWNTPFDVVSRELQGVTVWIPDDADRYLDENYGDWANPVPFYDISFDTPNRRYREGLDAVRFLHSRCVIGLRTRDRWLLESAVRELRDNFDIDLTDLLADSPLLATSSNPD